MFRGFGPADEDSGRTHSEGEPAPVPNGAHVPEQPGSGELTIGWEPFVDDEEDVAVDEEEDRTDVLEADTTELSQIGERLSSGRDEHIAARRSDAEFGTSSAGVSPQHPDGSIASGGSARQNEASSSASPSPPCAAGMSSPPDTNQTEDGSDGSGVGAATGSGVASQWNHANGSDEAAPDSQGDDAVASATRDAGCHSTGGTNSDPVIAIEDLGNRFDRSPVAYRSTSSMPLRQTTSNLPTVSARLVSPAGSRVDRRSDEPAGSDHRGDSSAGEGGASKRLTATPAERRKRGPAYRTIGRYEIDGQIASGAFGFVYRGHDRELGRPVAIKVARREVAGSASLRRLFEEEAEQASKLDHPGIVAVYERGLTDLETDPEGFARPFIVMAYCHGETLNDWLRPRVGTITPGMAARLMVQIADAVGHGHEQGVTHRDLKPGNVMVLDDGPAASDDAVPMLRVLDFGLAGDLAAAAGPTGRQVVAGSAAYMSPEQADGEMARPVSDVHALGAMLFKLLTGRTPYSEGDGRTRLLARLSKTTAPSPRQLDPTVPYDLAAICLKCLRKNPSERYADATELADDLRRYIDGRPVEARTLSRWQQFSRWLGEEDRIREAGAVLIGVHLFLPVWSIGGELGVAIVANPSETEVAWQQLFGMLAYLIGITWLLHGFYLWVAQGMFRGRPVRWAMRIAVNLAALVFCLHLLRGLGRLEAPSAYYAENPGARWQVFWLLSMTALVDIGALLLALRALSCTRQRRHDTEALHPTPAAAASDAIEPETPTGSRLKRLKHHSKELAE